MSKKELLARMLGRSGFIELIRRVRQLFIKRVRVLAYHRVYNVRDMNDFPYDPELISATVEDFTWQMDYLRKKFNVVSFGWVIEQKKSGRKIPSNTVIISFDDGHLDNYTQAFPILVERNLPATIFLSTDYINSDTEYWFEEVSRRINLCKPGNYYFESINESLTMEDVSGFRRDLVVSVLGKLKLIPNSVRLDFMAELRLLPEVDTALPTPTQSAQLTWQEIKIMSDNGIELGSHSLSHPVMSQLTPAELKREVTESKQVIEKQAQTVVKVFAYPVGKMKQISGETEVCLKESDYELAVSYMSGDWNVENDNPWEIRRLPVERYTSRDFFKAMLALPEIFKY